MIGDAEILLRTHSNGYIKGDKYFFFIKVGAEFSIQERWFSIQENHIYHTKQNQTFYGKIKCDLLNFRRVQNGYHKDF